MADSPDQAAANPGPSNGGGGAAASRGSAIRWLLLLVLLLALLLAAAWFYWNLTRPADLTGEGESAEGDHLFSIYGFEGDLLRRPSSVGIGPNGDIYVADTGKHRIVVFDDGGVYQTVYGEAGDEPLQIQNPIDVAVAADGRSYVLDKNAHKIVMFDPTNQASGIIPFEEEIFPLSVTVDDDMLFVTTESGIVVFDLEGNPLTGYVAWGQEPGQFDKPGGVALGEDGTMFIADSFNYRVQAISTEGEPLWQYGEPIPPDEAIGFVDETRKFGLPASIAVDESGFVYVVDGTNSEVVVLTPEGEFQETIGGVGHADGLFYYPDGIDYSDGTIVVADKFNDRVEVFRTPTASTVFSIARLWPLLLPLLLLPLLLLLRRRTKYVLNEDFVEKMHADPEGLEVAKALKRAFAAPDVVTLGESYENLELDWRAVDVDPDELDRLRTEYGLDDAAAESLVAATSVRGKRVLLTDIEPLRVAATQLEVPTLKYEELRNELVKQSPPAGGDADTGGEGV